MMMCGRLLPRAEVCKDLCCPVGVGDGIEGGEAHEFSSQDCHGQSLQSNANRSPLLGEAVGKAGLIVPFNPQHDRIMGLAQAGSACSANLCRTGYRGHEKDAFARFVWKASRKHEFKVCPGLGQRSELAGHAPGPIGNLTGPDVHAFQLEAHGIRSPLKSWKGRSRLIIRPEMHA